VGRQGGKREGHCLSGGGPPASRGRGRGGRAPTAPAVRAEGVRRWRGAFVQSATNSCRLPTRLSEHPWRRARGVREGGEASGPQTPPSWTAASLAPYPRGALPAPAEHDPPPRDGPGRRGDETGNFSLARLPPDRRRPEATRRRAGAAQPPAFMHKGKIVSASARPPLERLRRRPGRAGGHATAAAQASSTAAGALSSSGRPPASLS